MANSRYDFRREVVDQVTRCRRDVTHNGSPAGARPVRMLRDDESHSHSGRLLAGDNDNNLRRSSRRGGVYILWRLPRLIIGADSTPSGSVRIVVVVVVCCRAASTLKGTLLDECARYHWYRPTNAV